MGRKKDNSHIMAVQGSIDTLLETLFEINKEAVTTRINEVDLRTRIVKFLKTHGVNIDMSSKAGLREIIGGNGPPLAEFSKRTYIFSSDVLLHYMEEKEPAQLLESMLDTFQPVKEIGGIMDMMETVSEIMKNDSHKIFPDIISNVFPEVVETYSRARKKAKGKSAGALRAEITRSYTQDLETYLNRIRDALGEDLDEVDMSSKIAEARNGLFKYRVSPEKIPSLINVAYIEKRAKEEAREKGEGVRTLEEDYGKVVCVGYHRDLRVQKRTVPIITRPKDDTRHNVVFTTATNEAVQKFCIALCERAGVNKYGKNPSYRGITLDALKGFNKGYLTDKRCS